MRKNLINERHSKQKTQKEVSKANDITTRHYQNIEAGTSGGSIELWQRLSSYFNKPIDFLLENDTAKEAAEQSQEGA